MSFAIDEDVTTKTKIKPPKKYNIWALNNDDTSFTEVVIILTSALNMNRSVAEEITYKVDREGKARVNPKPMSKGIAESLLKRIEEVKSNLALMMPTRAYEIKKLKFIIKED